MFTKDDADVEVVKVVMVILVVVVFKLLFSSGKELGMIQCRNAQSWFCESSEMCVVWIAEIRQEWNNRNNRGIASMHSQSISRADWFLLAADMHFFCKWRDIVMVMFPGERSSQLSRKQTPKRIVNSILLLSNYVVVCLCWDVSAGQALTYFMITFDDQKIRGNGRTSGERIFAVLLLENESLVVAGPTNSLLPSLRRTDPATRITEAVVKSNSIFPRYGIVPPLPRILFMRDVSSWWSSQPLPSFIVVQKNREIILRASTTLLRILEFCCPLVDDTECLFLSFDPTLVPRSEGLAPRVFRSFGGKMINRAGIWDDRNF